MKVEHYSFDFFSDCDWIRLLFVLKSTLDFLCTSFHICNKKESLERCLFHAQFSNQINFIWFHLIKRANGNDAPMAALTSLISGCDAFWEQARTSAKRHERSIEWICELYKCSINQSINQSMNHLAKTWAAGRVAALWLGCQIGCENQSINQSINQ
jgi:hypothetical protein